jgi:AraC-like DNA-binding protein
MKNIYSPFQPTLTKEGLRKFGLKLEYVEPCNALKGIVRAYLQIKCKCPTPYPVIPDGTQAIYMSSLGSMIGGTQTESKDIQLFLPGEYFGIWFYPAGLRHFFKVNLSEISEQIVDIKYLESRYFILLHEQVYSRKYFLERAGMCETWFLKNYSKHLNPRFDNALSLIYQSSGNDRIESIAGRVGWSSRNLNRHFLQHTGLSTKTFSSIVRAQNVCKQLYLQAIDKENDSVEFGYYDQSHFIKSFKKHFKYLPSKFMGRFMSDFYNS